METHKWPQRALCRNYNRWVPLAQGSTVQTGYAIAGIALLFEKQWFLHHRLPQDSRALCCLWAKAAKYLRQTSKDATELRVFDVCRDNDDDEITIISSTRLT
jgi:hypothetical protein